MKHSAATVSQVRLWASRFWATRINSQRSKQSQRLSTDLDCPVSVPYGNFHRATFQLPRAPDYTVRYTAGVLDAFGVSVQTPLMSPGLFGGRNPRALTSFTSTEK